MNAAATQDPRATVWPAIRALLRTGNAPSARAEAAAGLVDSWRGMGSEQDRRWTPRFARSIIPGRQ